jgi:hypothetical protein
MDLIDYLLVFGFSAAPDRVKTQERYGCLSLLKITSLSTRYPRSFHSTLVSPLRYFGLVREDGGRRGKRPGELPPRVSLIEDQPRGRRFPMRRQVAA